MQCVILSAKGTYRCTNISCEGQPTGKEVAAVLRRATEPVFVTSWNWKLLQLHLWGYKTGKAGTENQHKIPMVDFPLYGDAVVVATMTEDGISQVAPLTTALFQEFLKQKEEGESDSDSEFETEGEEDSESEEEEIEEESDTDSELSVVLEEEEEEEAPPPPKRTKRITKKTPQWFTIEPVTPENEKEYHEQSVRIQARATIHAFLQLTGDEEIELERSILLHTLEDAKKHHVHPVWEKG